MASLILRRFSSYSSSTVSTASLRCPVHVLKGGNGPHSILCIPGALGTALSDYSQQLNYFSKHDSFNIASFDPIGYGKSQGTHRSFQTSPIHFLQQDAIDGHTLMTTLKKGEAPYSVLGWSDGGVASLFLASMFPRYVRKLIIWGANAYVSPQDIEMFEKTRNISNWSLNMREPLQTIYGDNLGPLWGQWIDSMVHVLVHKDGELCRNILHTIKSPTLILHGNKDPLVPEFHPLYLRDNISNSRLVRFPEGKHNIHIKYTNEFNSIIEKFLLE